VGAASYYCGAKGGYAKYRMISNNDNIIIHYVRSFAGSRGGEELSLRLTAARARQVGSWAMAMGNKWEQPT
jgi:hypothetical protein